MAPAFSSARQAAGFALLLFILLALPALVGRSLLPDRESVYSSMWWGNGAFPFIQQQIFAEKSDIDMAFIGPSHIWYGLDPRRLQESLSRRLGRPAVVRMFGWGTTGYDAIYFIAKDLLEHRKVKLLVFYDDPTEPTEPHPRMPHLFRFSEDADAVRGLPWHFRATYYFAAVLGMPRQLLDWVRTDLPADAEKSSAEAWPTSENIVDRFGSVALHEGYVAESSRVRAPFVPYVPAALPPASEIGIYPTQNPQLFRFTSGRVPMLEEHFIRKLAAVARDHHTRLALLSMPLYAQRRNDNIEVQSFWKQIFGPELIVVGIPPARLFAGMSDQDVLKLYRDNGHFSVNGQEYFTAVVGPALFNVYAESTSR